MEIFSHQCSSQWPLLVMTSASVQYETHVLILGNFPEYLAVIYHSATEGSTTGEEGRGRHSDLQFPFSTFRAIFFNLSMCVLEEREGQGTQNVVLNEIPISLKTGSLNGR